MNLEQDFLVYLVGELRSVTILLMEHSIEELALYKQLIGRLMLDYSRCRERERSWVYDAEDHPSIIGVSFEHMCMNPFETAAYQFFEWGICERPLIGSPPRPCGWTAKFIIDLKDVSELVDDLSHRSNTLSDCVSLFIDLQCIHNAQIPILRAPFSMDELPSLRQGIDFSRHRIGDPSAERVQIYKPEMDRFAAAGYATKLGDLYCWTDKIAPAMRKHYLWTDNGRYVHKVQEEQRVAHALAMWELMPKKMARKVLNAPRDNRKLLFVGLAAKYWHERTESWVDTPLDQLPFVTRLLKYSEILEDRGLFD